MSKPTSLWNRPLTRLAAFGFAAMFIMAPTPGNVGGCSSSAGSAPVQAGSGPGETPEYMYFDRGLCAGFCWRLRECGVLCQVLNVNYPGVAAICLPPACTGNGDCGSSTYGHSCIGPAGSRTCGCNGDSDCGGGSCDPQTNRCVGAGNDTPDAYTLCVRAQPVSVGGTEVAPYVSGLFDVTSCPHACPGTLQYHTAYEWDVQACTDAVLTRTCSQSGPGAIVSTFGTSGASECTNICR